MEAKDQIALMVEKSRVAQEAFAKFSQEQVDAVVREIAKTVYYNAEELARMAVDETKMGVYADKVAKNKGKSKVIWNDLKDKKSVGIIDRDEKNGLVLIAKPIGVIASVTPTTNPIVTPMSNAMFALKGRNSIIVAPHPNAKKCSSYTVELINKAIAQFNTPQDLIQVITEPSIELTNELMKAADVVVATGGGAMVKAAYSSGKPAFGVGPGNVQCVIDKGVDYDDAAKKMITGRIFDNGIICSGEQSAIIPEEDFEKVITAFEKNGAYFIRNSEERAALRNTLFVNGAMNKNVVGKSVAVIAEMAGLKVPEGTKVILVEAEGVGKADLLCKEKMCPVMIALKCKDFKDGVHLAQTNLNMEGKGHTAVVYSNNTANIEYAGDMLTVSRLVVNQPSSTTAGGSLFNGFAPTTTLGCGTWGNNSISENFTYKHMLNISRIGYFLKDKKAPTDEEIWAN